MNKQLFAVCIAGWYFTSIALAVYNKWMFNPQTGLGIEYPILMTTFHQLTLWVLSFLYIKIRHFNNSVEDNMINKSINHTDWLFYVKYLIPAAVATAGDIGFSNFSFKFVPLTVYTIIKSSSIAFVLLFSCIFKLEKFHWKLGFIVSTMFIGVSMMVYKPSRQLDNDESKREQSMIIFGSLLVMASSCLSGLRWVITQLILKKTAENVAEINNSTTRNNDSSANVDRLESKNEDENKAILFTNADEESQINKEGQIQNEKPHPIYTIYQLAPIMGIALLTTSLIIERPFPDFWHCNLFKKGLEADGTINITSIIYGIILVIIPGVGVLILTLSEFALLQLTRVLTLSIAGVVKEVLTILVGIILLSERINGFYNILGMCVVLADVSFYNYFRYVQRQKISGYIKLTGEDYDDNHKNSVMDPGTISETGSSNKYRTSGEIETHYKKATIIIESSSNNIDRNGSGNTIQDNMKTSEALQMEPYSVYIDDTVQEYEMNVIERVLSK